MRDSAVRVGLVYPELLGTYGDRGNALVLVQRCIWRGIDAELVEISAGEAIPDSLDLYLFGGGEDDPQAMAAAGMPPGVYTIDGPKVELDASGRVAAPGASNLAGSALTLSAAIGHAVRFTGLPLDDVVEMASGRPAGYLGIPPAGRVTAEWDRAASELRVLRVSL